MELNVTWVFYSLWHMGRPDMAPFIFVNKILKGRRLKFLIMAIN
jgi:hypothetical protein